MEYESSVPGLEGNDNTGGYSKVWFVPLRDVASIPATVGEVAPGDGGSVIITGDITFNDPLTQGWTEIYSTKDSQVLDSPVGGEIDGRSINHTLNFFLPGSTPQNEALAQKLKNDEVLILVQECGGPVELLGNDCDGVELILNYNSGQKTSGRKGYTAQGTWFGNKKFYEGAINLKP